MNLPAQYAKIYGAACEFIVSENIHTLPVNPFEIIRRNHWGLVTYKRLAQLCGEPPESIPTLCSSKDGYTIFNGRRYCIAYNSDIDLYGRIFFTLMHEIGHIRLGHFQISENCRTDYREMEREANFFAANVMAPFSVMRACGLTTVKSLHCVCALSLEAAARRLEQYRLWRPTSWDIAVQRAFCAYIRSSRKPFSRNIDISFDDWNNCSL